MWIIFRSWGGYSEGRRFYKQFGGFVLEVYSKVIFDFSFTFCCFLKILSYEIFVLSVFFYGICVDLGWLQ